MREHTQVQVWVTTILRHKTKMPRSIADWRQSFSALCRRQNEVSLTLQLSHQNQPHPPTPPAHDKGHKSIPILQQQKYQPPPNLASPHGPFHHMLLGDQLSPTLANLNPHNQPSAKSMHVMLSPVERHNNSRLQPTLALTAALSTVPHDHHFVRSRPPCQTPPHPHNIGQLFQNATHFKVYGQQITHTRSRSNAWLRTIQRSNGLAIWIQTSIRTTRFYEIQRYAAHKILFPRGPWIILRPIKRWEFSEKVIPQKMWSGLYFSRNFQFVGNQ